MTEDTRRFINQLPALIDKVFPLPARFRAALPRDVAALSRLLTSGREERGASYLGKPPLLSAYLRYFLPWNIYRLCWLLPALPLRLADGDALADLGCGPLTLSLALWIARPELRGLRLELRCLDKIGAALDAGKKLFDALTGGASPWTIKLIRAPLGAEIRGQKAALVTAVNVFNELFWELPHGDAGALAAFAEKNARLLASLTAENGAVLVVEPGIPQSGAFVAALRSSLIAHGQTPSAPCPHTERCPCSGGILAHGKAKWCHFAFETQDAPERLLRLSDAAGLPKERATMSYLFTGKQANTKPELVTRIISDIFPVSDKDGKSLYGRYGCSAHALVLVTGSRAALEKYPSGSLVGLEPRDGAGRDPKSEALIVALG
jgi:ribosomal protein RSM22 (predicted rRNA methylase)